MVIEEGKRKRQSAEQGKREVEKEEVMKREWMSTSD
jgi:hypothetical protein